ncbi:MAG: 30S ribosomal protein S13 [Candidatus ainarchaeum sp.]|nr:30S ribosomal protein S13 [Candidatus ainarchaeum sp.]
MAEKTEKKPEKTEKKDAKEASKEAPKTTAPKEKKIEKNVKGIKRIAGKDVSGDYKLSKALLRVRGIGKSLNQVVAKLLIMEMKLPANLEVGDLNDEQIEQIDKILANLGQYEIPQFMLNRRKDYMDGGNKHIIMNDLIFALKQDVERDKNTYSWKGYRHAYGQKVRGQRTRNTGRVGMTVGVLRKAVLAQAKAAAAPAGAAKPAAGPAPAPAAKPAAPAKK